MTTDSIAACSRILLAITLLRGIASSVEGGQTKETKMVMYLQDVGKGPNATGIVVAGANGNQSSSLSFGTVTVMDHALTEGINRKSREVGRARGLFVDAARDGTSLYAVFSIVMTEGQYKGSTLEIQGNNWILAKQREVSVVSGTGAFRFASGYVLIQLAFIDPPNLYAVLKLHVTVRHPAVGSKA